MSKSLYAVIMAGGSGTRFWPASRVDKPKQFLDVTGSGRTLIQMTYDRIIDIMPSEHIYVVADERYRDITQEQLPEIPSDNFIGEPAKKNTAPCVLLSAMVIAARDPEATILTCSADHIIGKPDLLNRAILSAYDIAASSEHIVTLGLKPLYPATGYGYIHAASTAPLEPSEVLEFVEKPDLHTAKGYLDSGKYLWNSGIFIWSVSTLIKAYEVYATDIYDNLKPIGDGNTDADTIRSCYADIRAVSVDYAILEHAQSVYVIPVDPEWSDLGTWNSLHDLLQPDGSTVSVNNTPLLSDTENLLIYSQSGKPIVVSGLRNYNIVDMDDVLMILPKDKDQEIKSIINQLDDYDPTLL